MSKKKIVIIGIGALMEKMYPCFEKFLGEDLEDHLLATTADAGDLERKKNRFSFGILLNDNAGALQKMQPDIIVYAVPPQVAAEIAERDLAPYYEQCRKEGKEPPALYVFPPRPAAEYYLGLLGEDLKVCHILPNVILSIAGEKLENEGLNFITLSEKNCWTEEDKKQLEDFLSATGACIYLAPKDVMAIMTSGVSVINYAYVLETMEDALNSHGYEVSMNTLAQGCRYALEEYTGYKPARSNADKPELPQEVYNAVSQFTMRMYDGLMKYCLELGLSKETAKAFLDGYFDFYLHYYMAESEEAIKGLVTSQTTKGGVAEKGEQIYKAEMQEKLREVFSQICSKEPGKEFYDQVEDYVINCSRQVLAHGANMGKKKS